MAWIGTIEVETQRIDLEQTFSIKSNLKRQGTNPFNSRELERKIKQLILIFENGIDFCAAFCDAAK